MPVGYINEENIENRIDVKMKIYFKKLEMAKESWLIIFKKNNYI